MSEVLRKVWHCDKCQHEWFTAEKPQRCPKCKARTWNVLLGESTPVPSVPLPHSVPAGMVQSVPDESDELDATAPETSGRGKATLTKVVKRKPAEVKTCSHGLIYHPGCNA